MFVVSGVPARAVLSDEIKSSCTFIPALGLDRVPRPVC